MTTWSTYVSVEYWSQDTVVNKMWRSIILCYGDECHTGLSWWIGAKLICMQPSISTGCYRHGMLVREIRRQGKVRSIFFESIVSTGMEDSKWVVIFLRSVFSWGNCVTFIFILAHTHTMKRDRSEQFPFDNQGEKSNKNRDQLGITKYLNRTKHNRVDTLEWIVISLSFRRFEIVTDWPSESLEKTFFFLFLKTAIAKKTESHWI